MVEALAVEVRHRRAMELDLPVPALGLEGGEAQALYCQILSVLQAENRGDTELLFEPNDVFDPGILADEESRQDFAHLRTAAATVIIMVVAGEGIIKACHAGKVKKRTGGVKVNGVPLLSHPSLIGRRS